MTRLRLRPRGWTRGQSGLPRARSYGGQALLREVQEGRLDELLEQPDDVSAEPGAPARPTTRGECVEGPRPCPWVSCRHHLYLDVNPRTGSIQLAHPHLEPDELEASCALDIAAEGDHPLDEVGELLNVSRERVRQIEELALRAVGRRLGRDT